MALAHWAAWAPRSQLIDDTQRQQHATRHLLLTGCRALLRTHAGSGLLTYRAPRLGAPTPEGCHQTRHGPEAQGRSPDRSKGGERKGSAWQAWQAPWRAPPTPDRWLAFPRVALGHWLSHNVPRHGVEGPVPQSSSLRMSRPLRARLERGGIL